MRTSLRALAALCLALAGACGQSSPGMEADASTAGHDASVPDASYGVDALQPLIWVDFAATGCADTGDSGECQGPAPLELRFTATAPAPVTDYIWSFGDDSPDSSDPSPLHVYLLPGSYDVKLVVGGPGGTASATRTGYVVVGAAAVGSSCQYDAQCGADADCVCDDATPCPASLSAGYCSRSCSASVSCPEGSACANLASSGAEPSDWARSLCLRSCEADGDCEPGLRCRELRGADGAAWVRGCFADGLLRDVGESCVEADGSLDDALCVGGVCLGLGIRGMCTASCSPACPSYAACAHFSDAELGSRCLARCDDTRPCDGDPLLACTASGGGGAYGFTVSEAPAPAGYCAPRACVVDADCGPDGACVDQYCTAR